MRTMRSRCSAAAAARGHWCLFYFLAFGGFVAMYLYLPKLLTGVHGPRKDRRRRTRGRLRTARRRLAGRSAGLISDRIGAERVLRGVFVALLVLAVGLAVGFESMAPLTVCCLTMALALGLGTGAVLRTTCRSGTPTRSAPSCTGVVGSRRAGSAALPAARHGRGQDGHRRLCHQAWLPMGGGRARPALIVLAGLQDTGAASAPAAPSERAATGAR